MLFFSFSETIADQIEIPSVFTSSYAARRLKEEVIPEHGWGEKTKPLKCSLDNQKNAKADA